jgi:hypothetical protein
VNPETAKEDVLTLAWRGGRHDEPEAERAAKRLVFIRFPSTAESPPPHDAAAPSCATWSTRRAVQAPVDRHRPMEGAREQMGKKVKAIELKMSALKAGFDY